MNIPFHQGYVIVAALRAACRLHVRDYLTNRKSKREGLKYFAATSLSMAKQHGEAIRTIRAEWDKEKAALLGGGAQ